MSSVSANAQKMSSKTEFSSSGLYRSLFAGVATSVCSVLIFLLDSSVPQDNYRGVPGLYSAGRELAVYALVLCAALVCTKGAYSTKTSLEKPSDVFVEVRRRASTVTAQVGQCMSELKNCLSPPQRRAGHDKPVVPAWAILAVVGATLVLGCVMFAAAFLAGSDSQDPFKLFDAAPRACGPDGKPLKMKSMSWSSMGWIATAIWLSSGLCVTHPLSSGLILGV